MKEYSSERLLASQGDELDGMRVFDKVFILSMRICKARTRDRRPTLECKTWHGIRNRKRCRARSPSSKRANKGNAKRRFLLTRP
jgi:hypothetical protein